MDLEYWEEFFWVNFLHVILFFVLKRSLVEKWQWYFSKRLSKQCKGLIGMYRIEVLSLISMQKWKKKFHLCTHLCIFLSHLTLFLGKPLNQFCSDFVWILVTVCSWLYLYMLHFKNSWWTQLLKNHTTDFVQTLYM